MADRKGLFSTIRFIEKNDYARIHEASLEILKDTGVEFANDQALALFKKHGARTEGQRVFISKNMVDEALSSLKRTYRFSSRNKAQEVNIGEDFCVQPSGGAIYIQDRDRGRRYATLEDYGNLMKLAQSSNLINLVGAHPINPSDIPNQYKHLYMCYEILKNTDKPVLGWAMSERQTREFLDMIQIAMGDNPGENSGKQYANLSVNPQSPLTWSFETIGSIIQYASRGQGIYLLPCVMAGITGPMQHMGTIVLQNTEILSGIVFCKLINSELPLVYSPSSTIGYMKDASYICGTPDMMMLNAPLLMMAHEFYNLPSRCMCGMTDAKEPDMQAGFETLQNVMLAILSDADIISQCLGVLNSIMTISYEKHIIDEEIIKRCLYLKTGIDTSREALSLDLIKEIGPGSVFLTHHNTFTHFKDTFQNEISDCESYHRWQNGGGQDIIERANKQFKEKLEKAPDTLLDRETDKALCTYLKKLME